MGKRYKKQRSDSSLFHHDLVKILLIHQLQSQNDSWDSFITQNGYGNPDLGDVDKLVVEETLVHPTTSLSPPQMCVSSPKNEPLIDPKVIE